MNAYLYARYVFEKTINKYDLIIYTSPEDVPVVDDGERSINIEFRNEIIETFERFIKSEEVPSHKLVRLRGNVEQRMEQIFGALSIGM
jgi:nicotinamide riboside kinase